MQGKSLFPEVEVTRSLSNIIKSPVVKLNREKAVYIDIKLNHVKQEIYSTDIIFEENSIENSTENSKENILMQAEQDAQKIILDAEEKAALILDKAKNDAESKKSNIEQEARQRGYDEGYKKGSKESERLYYQAKAELDNALKEKQKIIDEIEPKMIDLILDICEKILGNTIRTNEQSILHLIRKGFSEVKDNGDQIVVRVSEHDYKTVLEFKEDISDSFGFSGKIDIVKDFSLKLGDCIIESQFGNIDCSLGTQFKALRQELLFITGA